MSNADQREASASRPLHAAFPKLARSLPHAPIAELPTPLRSLGEGHDQLFVKLDGHTHSRYGGNKVRKLEYLLAQARAHGCSSVATFGTAGSNHATATAVHAADAGLGCINFLSRQRPTPFLRGNLLTQIHSGARLVYLAGDRQARRQLVHDTLQSHRGRVWLIPMGGSSVTGTLGYVNAAFELAGQVRSGAMPKPARVYLPLGTMGSAVGLALGLRAAGLATRVIAVRVVHETIGSDARARRLYQRTARLLHRLDESFPRLDGKHDHLLVRDEQFGGGYALATPAARSALTIARERFGLKLETTYSAKALAALLADLDTGALDNGATVFWNTYSAAQPAVDPDRLDLRSVPPELAAYLEDD